MYLERLSVKGIESSKYYQSKKFNHGLGKDEDLPNCVQYVVSRAYESCEVDEPFIMFRGRSAGGYPDAGNFYKDSILPKGQQPRIGIACFDNHVAFIERVNEDGTCLITDSRYDPNKSLRNDRYWRKLDLIRLAVGQRPNISGVGKYQGCLYIPINDIRVIRDNSKDQISINEDMVNVRVKPNDELTCLGCYAPMGLYNVLEVTEDLYKWFRIDKDCWVREGDWINYYSEDEIKRLTEENKNLKKENEILKGRLKDIHELSEVEDG